MLFAPLMCVNACNFEYPRIIYELGKNSSVVNVVLVSGLKLPEHATKPADKFGTKMLRIHSDFARFTSHELKLSCKKSGRQKVLQKEERSSTFAT